MTLTRNFHNIYGLSHRMCGYKSSTATTAQFFSYKNFKTLFVFGFLFKEKSSVFIVINQHDCETNDYVKLLNKLVYILL